MSTYHFKQEHDQWYGGVVMTWLTQLISFLFDLLRGAMLDHIQEKDEMTLL